MTINSEKKRTLNKEMMSKMMSKKDAKNHIDSIVLIHADFST